MTMATIISVGDSRSARRCDATCHTAKRPACSCVCGGRYHGIGSSSAAQQQLTQDWLGEDWKAQRDAIEARGGFYPQEVLRAIQQAIAAVAHGPMAPSAATARYDAAVAERYRTSNIQRHLRATRRARKAWAGGAG